MALIGRLIVILFAFFAACFVAGIIALGTVLFPELGSLGTPYADQNIITASCAVCLIFSSGFALVPAMLIAAITEAFYVRSALIYAVGGGLIGLACYLG